MSDQAPPGAASDRERARAVLEQLKSVHAFDLGYEMMVGLVTFGYQKMGLTDETRPVRDLDDVRVAIEMLRAILEAIEREQGGERTRELHDTLAQMQLGYAHAVQLAGAEHAAAAPAEEAAGPDAAPAEEAAEPDAAPAAEPDAAPAAEPADESAEAPADVSGAKEQPAAKKPAVKRPAAKKKAAKKKAGKKKPAPEGPADDA